MHDTCTKMQSSALSESEDTSNNNLFERLPFLVDALLAKLDLAATLQLSNTCTAWRHAVQQSLVILAPKSELAMKFVGNCQQLRRLQLSNMLPAQRTAGKPPLSYLSRLTCLTHLMCNSTATPAWLGRSLRVAPGALAYVTGCTALQVLGLAQQPCVLASASLATLSLLPALTYLDISISGSTWVPPAAAWKALQQLTRLHWLNISGWARCTIQVTPAAQTTTSTQICPEIHTKTTSTTAAAAAAEDSATREAVDIPKSSLSAFAAEKSSVCRRCKGTLRRDLVAEVQNADDTLNMLAADGKAGSGRQRSHDARVTRQKLDDSGSSSSSLSVVDAALARLLRGLHHATSSCCNCGAPTGGYVHSALAAPTTAAGAEAEVSASKDGMCAASSEESSTQNTSATAARIAAEAASPTCTTARAATRESPDATPTTRPHTAEAPTVNPADVVCAAQPGVRAVKLKTVEAPAPLELLGDLTALRVLVMADWTEPPSCAGAITLQHLPHLTHLDISRCLWPAVHPSSSPTSFNAAGSSSSTVRTYPTSLLAMLQGNCHPQWRREPAAGADPATQLPCTVMGTSASAGVDADFAKAAPEQSFFSKLQRLQCCQLGVKCDPAMWAALSHQLTHLDVAGCSKFTCEGVAQLTVLQELVASDCPQLDYDAVKECLDACKRLTCLDLRRSTVILHGGGMTATQLKQGTYEQSAVLRHASWSRIEAGLQGNYQQPQQQQLHPPHHTGTVAHVPETSSRRDASSFAWADPILVGQTPAVTTAGARCPLPAEAAAASLKAPRGLQELRMSECHVAFEAFVWPQDLYDPALATTPSILLVDLVASRPQELRHIRILRWDRADSAIFSDILTKLVLWSSNTLTELVLSGCSLPNDPCSDWQALAVATNLRVLDLNNAAFSRRGYLHPCGTNPTVALLSALAGMRLEQLHLAGWKFYFASFKPLAGLSGCLTRLDLSVARDVTDSTLWSLTHLTGLSWLSICGASASNEHIFSLIFLHLSNLRHLDVSRIGTFSARSLPAVLSLPDLTSLDMRATRATASPDAVNLLTRLLHLRRLALPVAEVEGCSQPCLPTPQMAEAGSGSGKGPAANNASRRYTQQQYADAPEQLLGYCYLGELGSAQSLRQLLLGGSTPALTEYCRRLLPPWIDVR